MLNCLYFQTCLSSSCLSPPPPDKHCLLEKARQIGRDVRHTSNCKVTDADLQDYFQTLSTLLTDPICLHHDPSACTRLRDLQNDRMSIEELGELLKEAYQTLKHAKEAGEQFSEEAERTLSKALDATILFGEQRLQKKTQIGERRLKSQTHAGQQCLKRRLRFGNSALKAAHNLGEQYLESKAHIGEKHIESKTQLGEERVESMTQFGEQRIKSKTQHGEQLIECRTQLGEQCIESKTHDAKQCLENKIQDGTQRIEHNVKDGILRMKQAAHETSQVDYEQGLADLRRRLLEHYKDNSSNVPLSALDQSLDKRITDIYATPKIHRIEIANDGKRVKKEKVLTYNELFYTEDTKSNRRIYVQGEPGSGKSTFAAKLVHDWCDENQPSTAAPNENASFDDVLIIQKFKFIFFISLRESRGQTDVIDMIQKQLIDTMFSKQKRDGVNILLHQIIETELCLVIRDGLDEWVAPHGSNLAEPSMAGFPKDKCTVLTTARPWKLADERIKNSHIDILLEIEGIADPYGFSEKILRCILDESKDLKATVNEFESFIDERALTPLSYSPMLYTLVICTWVETIEKEEHLKGFSFCALYTTLLESLCKKANDTTGCFNDLNPPKVKCFSSTSYLQPIIQNVDVISKAAFHLLFSPEKETSIVFNDYTLSNYLSESEKEFALKAGLISKRKTKKASNGSISFIHKSMQEFLAAYHIALNAHVFDDIISGYLTRHKDAYLDISQVFIFLCGLNISAANKLSGMMDEQNAKMMDDSDYPWSWSWQFWSFQNIIEEGYREAVSNEQTGILLRLSHINYNENKLSDINIIWVDNTTNVLDLTIWNNRDKHSSPAHNEPTCYVELDLSTFLKRKSLRLEGSGIRLQESGSSVSSSPIWIVVNSADPVQCACPTPRLPCKENITFDNVTCSCTCLRSLFSTQLTHHNWDCERRTLSSFVEAAARESNKMTVVAIVTCRRITLHMFDNKGESPGLWEGLNIKSLSLSCGFSGLNLNLNHAESLSQALSSLKHLETLSILVNDDNDGLWKTLHGLNIKSLSLTGGFGGLTMNHAESMSQSLSSLTNLETLSIQVLNSRGLWEALHGLNIKSLSLSCEFTAWNVYYADSMSQSLSSLTNLETLSIQVLNSRGLWEALHGLNIKSLSVSCEFTAWNVYYAGSMSQSLSSLTNLETLSIQLLNSPGLLEALHGLNIKSLSLSCEFTASNVYYAGSMSQSLSSLTNLETFSIYMQRYINIQLPQSMKQLNIYCSALLPSKLRELVDTLSACTQTVEWRLEFGCASFEGFTLKRIPLDEYIAVQQELETLKNVVVQRLRILDRKTCTCDCDAESHWSVRGIGGVHNDTPDDDNEYERFVSGMNYEIINRISMRLLITPAANS